MDKSTTHIHGEPFERYCNGCFDLLAVAAAKAETERDAATGALAAARSLMREVEFAGNGRKTGYCPVCVGWRTRPIDGRPGEFWCNAEPNAHTTDCALAAVVASPAADLAARHDAEVERRALEKAVAVADAEARRADEARTADSKYYGVDVATRIGLALRALATPTPEKPHG